MQQLHAWVCCFYRVEALALLSLLLQLAHKVYQTKDRYFF